MKANFEWQINHPKPDGTISVVVRLTKEECKNLNQQLSEDIGTAVLQCLQDALADGQLLVDQLP